MQRNLYFDDLSGTEFEEYLLKIFQGLGYKGMTTQPSNDFGADLLVSKDGETTAVQAKCYAKPVGISAIQEVIGAKSYYSADRCLVVTTSDFTSSAIELARVNDVELWDRSYLIDMIVQSIGDAAETPEVTSRPQPPSHKYKEFDSLLYEAASLVAETGYASTALLQRKFRISYARAVRVIDQLEHLGIVGKFEGLKPRDVLITKSELNEIIPKENQPNVLFRLIRKYVR
ncbi:restriction endonuclease [uncultured Aminobacterium sp.]|uniref:restriction endonuclease n=1 Tax=uncultured Aminobacterium sp. TaxID=548265 RepID=UPI0025951A7C|nr:restriction endonuclease [uncultured Aminobacterium sp.]